MTTTTHHSSISGMTSSLMLLLLLSFLSRTIRAFSILPTATTDLLKAKTATTTTKLYDGKGISKDGYEWIEDFMEIELRVKIPIGIRPKDIRFASKLFGIDLHYNDYDEDGNNKNVVQLLRPERRFRGPICIDGTFWNLEDDEDDENNNSATTKTIVVNIEKNIRPPSDDFEVIDYDWGGVYEDETEDSIVWKNYTDLEEMDMREYAGRMGVDIDNINMSQVDKTMFTSGLNMTQNTLDQLHKRGMVEEVTQQSDGKEYVTDEDGNAVPFENPIKAAGNEKKKEEEIPFLDTQSQWKTDKPSYKMDELMREIKDHEDKSGVTTPLNRQQQQQRQQQRGEGEEGQKIGGIGGRKLPNQKKSLTSKKVNIRALTDKFDALPLDTLKQLCLQKEIEVAVMVESESSKDTIIKDLVAYEEKILVEKFATLEEIFNLSTIPKLRDLCQEIGLLTEGMSQATRSELSDLLLTWEEGIHIDDAVVINDTNNKEEEEDTDGDNDNMMKQQQQEEEEGAKINTITTGSTYVDDDFEDAVIEEDDDDEETEISSASSSFDDLELLEMEMKEEYELCQNSSEENDSLRRMTVSNLKELLRREGLKVTGKKSELIQRLSNHYDDANTENATSTNKME